MSRVRQAFENGKAFIAFIDDANYDEKLSNVNLEVYNYD